MTRRRDLLPAAPEQGPDSAGAVLRAILDHGPVARSSVARATRLSAASVSGLVASLMAEGLVREAPEAAGPPGTGRPHVPVDIEPDRAGVIGAHIAVEHTTVALLDLRGRVVEQRRERHARRDPASVLAALTGRIRRLGAGRRVLGVGVATGGWVDAVGGVLVEHDLLGWRRVPLGAVLAETTGLPVGVDSNSRALLRAEQLLGGAVARARRSAVHLFVGDVVDVAFSANGTVHCGPRSAAGAHVPIDVTGSGFRAVDAWCRCGRAGCFQAALSDRTVVRRFLEIRAEGAGTDRAGTKGDSTGRAGTGGLRAVLDAAAAGDPTAERLLLERARLAGRAAALLFDLFDPEVLFVAEAGVIGRPERLAALRAEAGADADEVIRPTSFPRHTLAVAGGAVALDRVYAAPLTPADRRRAG